RKRCLSLEHKKHGRLTSVEFSFFTLVLLLGIVARDRGRAHASLRRSQRLQSIAHINLNQLFELLALRRDTFAFDQRMSELAFGGAIAQRQTDRDADPKVVELI